MAIATLTDDWDYYIEGPYIIENNVWNKGKLVNGVNYTQEITYDTDSLSNGITFTWSWPAGNGDVIAYPEITAGKSPHWHYYDDQLTSSRISDLKEFEVSFDISVAANSSFRNLSFDLWLTSKKFGNEDTITTEVMVWVDSDGIDPWGKKMGTLTTEDGDKASIFYVEHAGVGSREWSYVAVVFDDPRLNGEFNLREILETLATKGLVSNRDFVSGFEFGAEITGGQGSFTLDNLDYSLTSFGATRQADELDGTGKNDRIYGLAGHDVMDGSNGNDILFGGRGHDILTGGAGADMFVFRGIAARTTDVITDFVSGEDQVQLGGKAFRAMDDGVLADAAFSSDGSITAATRIIFNQDNGSVYFDANGSGSGGRRLLFTLADHHEIVASDFLIL